MDYLSRDDINENVVIIKINKSYREGMSSQDLYDITRGFWKRKIESVEKAEYAFSVVFGEIKEVYKIDKWISAEQIESNTRPFDPEKHKNRIAFIGEIADGSIRDKYIGKNVNNLFKHGEADPVKLLLSQAVGSLSKGDINKEAKPLLIIQTDEYPIVVCPNCENSFIKAPGCPECGQLITYGKEKWNKPKLESLEDWEEAARIDGITAKEGSGFVRKLSENECLSYHMGAVDLAIDLFPKKDMKSLNVLMLFGKGGTCAFQPKEYIQYLTKYGLSRDAADWFMDVIRPYLSEEQTNKPYERENGYYYIDYTTIVREANAIQKILLELRDRINNGL